MNKAVFLLTFIYSSFLNAEKIDYQAQYKPLNCIGIAVDYKNMYTAKWTFEPAGGSGSLVDIRYNKNRTSVSQNGDLYGRGKWIGRTSSRIYNTLVEINYSNEEKTFELISLFNPDNFHMTGKCSS